MTQPTYQWTDNPTVSGVSVCDTDVLNDCLMHLKYDKKDGSGGFNLFDFKITDHILSGDEATGWMLQGSLVTMTYPDAVNKIKALYEDGIETTYRGITCKQTIDGRYIADISKETEVDELFQTTGVVDIYVYDSVNQQFYLPKTKWFHQFTLNTSLVNTFNEAGLPNITTIDGAGIGGRTGFSVGDNISPFMQIGSISNGHGSGGNAWAGPYYGFDASLANSIYGNSDSVQPNSSNKLLYYKVGGTIVNESTIDVENVLTELQQKADYSLSNAVPSQVFINNVINWGLPDYSAGVVYIDPDATSVSTTEGSFTAPCDGVVNVCLIGHNNSRATLFIDDRAIGDLTANGNGWALSLTGQYSVEKGSVVRFKSGYAANPTLGRQQVIFYPLKGANQ